MECTAAMVEWEMGRLKEAEARWDKIWQHPNAKETSTWINGNEYPPFGKYTEFKLALNKPDEAYELLSKWEVSYGFLCFIFIYLTFCAVYQEYVPDDKIFSSDFDLNARLAMLLVLNILGKSTEHEEVGKELESTYSTFCTLYLCVSFNFLDLNLHLN